MECLDLIELALLYALYRFIMYKQCTFHAFLSVEKPDVLLYQRVVYHFLTVHPGLNPGDVTLPDKVAW